MASSWHHNSHQSDHFHECQQRDCRAEDDGRGLDRGSEGLEGNFLDEMHPCCEKDAASKARGLEVRAALDKVDPTQIVARTRQAAVARPDTTAHCMLPMCHNQDYPALEKARKVTPVVESHAGKPGIDTRYRRTNTSDHDDGDEDDDDDDLDHLLDDPELLRMEQARVERIQADASRLAQLRKLGFGLHLEVAERIIEETVIGQFRGAGVIAHFYDPDSAFGASLDLFLESKAGLYMGTRFIRCRVRPGAAVASRMRVKRVPALACYKGGIRVAYTEDMAQLGSQEGVDHGAVGRWLDASAALESDPPSLCALEDMTYRGCVGRSRTGRNLDSDSEDDDDSGGVSWRYDCGVEGCSKPFEHNHISANCGADGGTGGGGLPEDFEMPF